MSEWQVNAKRLPSPTAERKKGVVFLYRDACRPRDLFRNGVSNRAGGVVVREVVLTVVAATLSPSALGTFCMGLFANLYVKHPEDSELVVQ